MRETVFISPIGKYLDEFVSMKRSIEYKYEANIYQLKSLDTACLEFGNGTVCLQKAVVDKWTSRRSNESTRTYLRRINLSNEVAEYLRLRGINAYILPQSHISVLRSGQEVYIPHIFSQQELEAFFHAADCHPFHRAHPICNTMYSILFRLLYCCGLRVSEALRLTHRDIDTTDKKLYIYNSKFCKDRIVPYLSLCTISLLNICILCKLIIMTIFMCFLPGSRKALCLKEVCMAIFGKSYGKPEFLMADVEKVHVSMTLDTALQCIHSIR